MTSPLTDFIIKMMATPLDRLANADPAKLAAKYGIRADHAAGYIALWRGW
jgi:hypothetical protein